MADPDGTGADEGPSTPLERELQRELMEQFYRLAVERYGMDSDQARRSREMLRAANEG